MAKVVVTRETLLDMAQRCAAMSQRRSGMPILDDAADLLEQASFKVADLERQLERWDRFGKLVHANMPGMREFV